MIKRVFQYCCFCIALTISGYSADVKYTLSFEDPQTHYIKVQMEVKVLNDSVLDLKMPVWTPGSYMVREFSKNVERFRAYDERGMALDANKFSKNGWRIRPGKSKSVSAEYYVYAFELTVRTSFVDIDHAYINGTSVFLYNDKLKDSECIVAVKPFPAWKKISTSLLKTGNNGWTFKAMNYDELADSPMEIGNHVTFGFIAEGIPHEVAMYGIANYDTVQLKKDLPLIVSAEKKIFGDHPCTRYVFIIHNIPNGSGGLEHLNSTTIQVGRTGYTSGSQYNSFLALAAHEYFHLWNVKRLRPFPLGPFDYDNENYTRLLYVAEGITAYYDDLVTRRCGFLSEDLYVTTAVNYVNSIANNPGSYIQSVAESGFDAWIKYYRPNENSANATVSYYIKGALIGCLLDLYILDATGGTKQLDDVMKNLYAEYYKRLNRGYTENEFITAVEKTAGRKMTEFFDKYVYGTDTIPYEKYFRLAGLKLKDQNAEKKIAFLGANSSSSTGKIMITAVERAGPAWYDGLNVNDEIIAVDGQRLNDDLSKFIAGKNPGDKLLFTVSRMGILRDITVTLKQSPKVNYILEKDNPTEKEQLIYKKWVASE